MEKLAVGLAVLFILGGIGFQAVNLTTFNTMTCTVSDKDRTKNSDGNSDARVYTEDCGTLQVADSLTQGNFHASDTYAKIKAGGRYEFRTQGIRVPFFSMFPNILEVKSV